MTRVINGILLVSFYFLVFTGCRKKAFDEYYGRPAGLADPIYQQLTAKGNFTSLLACIDKAGYKDILSAAGYWTMFAANDSAFKNFFTVRGIAGVSQLDSGTAKQIVTYSLVYNAFMKARLGDFQSVTGWVANQAFKRRTAYYTGFYTDVDINNKKLKALSSNRNAGFILGDNNNKYIPYFVNNFVANKGLSAADYNYFYPNSTYTGFNVVDAWVVNQDIVAENGYIHEINKVLLPLPNIDEYLASNPQYSEFKKLFDKYMVQFVLNSDATSRFKILTGIDSNVYIKFFNNNLAFSPNNENYLKLQDNDGQYEGWTMFVPKNDILLSYINSVILENYRSLDQIPLQIIIDFLNAHMWQASVWPSKFATTNNFQAEPARFNPNTDIIDKKILSNGIFYGTNKVQQANVFSTVYGKPYLDPKYLLMTRALDQSIRYNITVPSLKYTVFMMSDALLRAKGYDYSSTLSAWTYTVPGGTTLTSGNTPRDNLQRILATQVVPTPNGELEDLSGSGIVETFNGEYIKYNAGAIESAGLHNNGPVPLTARIDSTKTSSNGRLYYLNDLLTFDTTSIGNTISTLGKATSSNFNYFYQLLSNSALYSTAPASKTTEIVGLTPGVFYTVFIPNNAAVLAAAKAGLLPIVAATGLPNFVPTVQSDRDLINNFILYHILNKNTVVPDGKKTGNFETLFKKASGDPGTITISSAPNSMQVKDNKGRTANVVIVNSNNLASRCVIHLIDNYLQYDPN